MIVTKETQDKPEEGTFRRSVLKQFVLGLLMNFSNIAPSMSLGYSAVALPIMKNQNNTYYLTEDQGSWFASMASLATPIGCLLSGPIADIYGRRGAIFCVNIIGFIGWIIVASAYYLPHIQYPILLFGRTFTGLSTGLSSIPASIYMAEIASVKLIGVFTAWSSISFSLGVLVVYVLGWFLKSYWGTIALITAAFPCFGMLFTIFFIPESPAWLVSKSRYEDATRSMCKIWGAKEAVPEIRREIEYLINNKTKSKINTNTEKTFKTKLMNKFKYFRRRTCWKPLLIVTVLFFTQQFAGVFSIVFYAIDICKAAGIDMDPYLAITIIGSVRLITAMAASFINRKVGKKPMFVISGIGVVITMLGLGIYVNLKNAGKISDTQYDFLPSIFMFSYFIISTTGLLIVPFALSAEVYPVKIRGLASAVTGSLGYLFNFITVKSYPSMVTSIGIQGVFYFYGCISLAGTMFAVLFLPETRNKTIEEIEDYFDGKKSKNQLTLLEIKA